MTHDVHALLPEATVVDVEGGPAWEGSGVQPDSWVRLDSYESLDIVALDAGLTRSAQLVWAPH